jgi:hypothetical protein
VDVNQYHGVYTRGSDIIGVSRGRVKDDKYTGVWVEAGGQYGQFELTWNSANTGFTGNYYYEDKAPYKKPYDWSALRTNTTQPSPAECLSSVSLTSGIFQGTWQEQNNTYKICSNTDTSRMGGSYLLVNGRQGNMRAQAFDNGRVVSGLWYESATDAQSIGAFIFVQTEGGSSMYGVWWTGFTSLSSTTGFVLTRNVTATRNSFVQPNLTECAFDHDAVSVYAQKWTGYFVEDIVGGAGQIMMNLRGNLYGSYSRSLDVGVALDIAGIIVGKVSADGNSVTGSWYEIGDTTDATANNMGGFVWFWNTTDGGKFSGTWGYQNAVTGGGTWNHTKMSIFSTAYDAFVISEENERAAGQWQERLDDAEYSTDSIMYICATNGVSKVNYWNGIGLGSGIARYNDKIIISAFSEQGFRSATKAGEAGNGVALYALSPWKTLRGYYWSYDPEDPAAVQTFSFDDTHNRQSLVEDSAKCQVTRPNHAVSSSVHLFALILSTLYLLHAEVPGPPCMLAETQ